MDVAAMSYAPPPDLLKDAVILVTGAGDGIGRAIALAAAAHGATVVLLGRTLAKLEAVYDAIEQAGGAQPAIFPVDFEGATAHDYALLGERLDQTFGRVDGIVHCAATFPYLSRIDDYDADTWGKVLQVNLSAPFLLTQACLPLLRRAPAASVVFVSDAVGRHGRAYWGAYAVSKAGLERLSQVLADELAASGIRVNTLDPGPTRTRLRAQAYPVEDPSPLKPPEAVVPLLLWLLGPDGLGATGQAWTHGDDPWALPLDDQPPAAG
jgi:NAD(P)-dependent dehydrogenase (short-subunit alcohol dehydrogenase family)